MTPALAAPMHSREAGLPERYSAWTEADVWHVFLRLVTRDSPLPGMRKRLQEYRALFGGCYETVRGEHAIVPGSHFRAADGVPFVNPLNIEHLTRLLHHFTHQLWKNGADAPTLDALFFVLKSRCQINLFYRQPVGRYFFPFHALGAVIGYGSFGDFLVITQGTTIGHNHNKYPTIGSNVVLSPGSAILGDCKIGNNVLLGAGALVIDQTIADDTIVLGRPPAQILKANPRDNRALNFDMAAVARLTPPGQA